MTAIFANAISICSRFFRLHKRRLSFESYKLPMPKHPHVVLTDKIIGNRKLLIIGDLHGCLDEFEEVLATVKKKHDTKEFLTIFVGDLINKGPKNVETLHRVRELEHFSVRGNHDESVLRHSLQIRDIPGYQPPPRYLPWIHKLCIKDLDYLQELPYTISIPSYNVIIVHAGIVPNISLEHQKTKDMIIMRNLTKDENGDLIASSGRDEGEPWASLWNGPEHIYFGHDAVRMIQKYPFATGLDSGCVYGNQLTAVLLSKDSTREFITIQAKEIYEKPQCTS